MPSEQHDAATLNKTRLRIRFTKCGDVRWISHRDLARVWERLLRRAGLQLAFSQGFHPKPRISFPSALALGIEALDEVVELEVLGIVELESIEAVLRREMPAGMELLELHALKTSLGKAKVLGASYRIAHGLLPQSALDEIPTTTPVPSVAALQLRIDAMRQLASLDLDREGKVISCPTHDSHFDLSVEQEFFLFSIPNVAQGSIRPSELLDYFGLGHLLEAGVTLQRTAVHLQEPAQVPHST
ncbi:MAG: TIGR03936 family radical SAM-associated protein [Aureliella sp.]